MDGRPAFAELEHLTDELPPTERAAVVLRYGYDLDYAEIGAALGSTATRPARRPPPACAGCEKELDEAVSPDLDRRFREAAAAEGLLDVAYDLVDTPVGTLLVAATDRGLCRISFDPSRSASSTSSRARFGAACCASAKPVDPVRRELDEYFEGKRHAVRPRARRRAARRLQPRVLAELARVPYGEVDDLRRARREGRRSRAPRAPSAPS